MNTTQMTLNKPIPRGEHFSKSCRLAVSHVFQGEGAASKTVRSEKPRFPSKEEQTQRLYQLVNLPTLVGNEALKLAARRMQKHIDRGCMENTFYSGSQGNECGHRWQNRRAHNGKLGARYGEARLAIYFHGYNCRIYERRKKTEKKNNYNLKILCPHLEKANSALFWPRDVENLPRSDVTISGGWLNKFGILPDPDRQAVLSHLLEEVGYFKPLLQTLMST
jgi:hypothetical protein